MSKPVNNKAVMAAAIILLALAVILSVLLLTEDGNGGTSQTQPQQTTTQSTTNETTTQFQGLFPVVDSKFLWQYGSQQIASDKPVENPSEEEETSHVSPLYTQRVPETYYEVVTNWKGEAVTGEDGSEVTEIRTKPQTTVYTEYVTNENGENVTDENGKPVTQLHSEVVTTAPPPVYVTGENGEQLTDESGNPVTELGTTVAESTTAAVGNNNAGESKWAQGFSDGERYIRMKIYIDGEYDITRSSVMTMTLREKSGLISIPDTLTYNLYKGTCSLSPTKKYNEMAYVTKTGGQTVVTLIIPEEARPLVSQTTSFKASSTISTFRDGNGDTIDEFTVSVELS
ncbi:MAG: hypothetical protein IKC20_02800 [Clostridia bacterium]|nr:hypothetical protein [Clostridia bacterium]